MVVLVGLRVTYLRRGKDRTLEVSRNECDIDDRSTSGGETERALRCRRLYSLLPAESRLLSLSAQELLSDTGPRAWVL